MIWRSLGVFSYIIYQCTRFPMHISTWTSTHTHTPIHTYPHTPPTGLHVYDSCGRESRAAEGVGEVFPVLREGPSSSSSCPSSSISSSSSNDTLRALGLMDLTGATNTHPSLASLLRQYKVPVLNLSPATLLPPLQRGQVSCILQYYQSLPVDLLANGKQEINSW